MFTLKKVLSGLLMPYTLGMVLLIWGLAASWLSRRPRAGRLPATAGTTLLLLAGLAPVSHPLIGSLESRYQPLSVTQSLADVKWIVVLGGGHTPDPTKPPFEQLSDGAKARLTEGIRLHRLIPGSRLLVSGAGDPISHARVLADAAEDLGVAPEAIETEERTLDTEDEARLIGERVGKDRMILVTSASHMVRAMTLFHARGIDPTPAPTDFSAPGSMSFPGVLFPQAGYLEETEHAVHEYIGRVWTAIRIRVARP